MKQLILFFIKEDTLEINLGSKMQELSDYLLHSNRCTILFIQCKSGTADKFFLPGISATAGQEKRAVVRHLKRTFIYHQSKGSRLKDVEKPA